MRVERLGTLSLKQQEEGKWINALLEETERRPGKPSVCCECEVRSSKITRRNYFHEGSYKNLKITIQIPQRRVTISS